MGVSNAFMLELDSLICQTNKSMSPVSAQIYLKYSRSSGIIVTVWGKTKVGGGEKTSSLYHSRHSYGPGTLIGIDFHPETSEK